VKLKPSSSASRSNARVGMSSWWTQPGPGLARAISTSNKARERVNRKREKRIYDILLCLKEY
jgi:hypothetical protein